MGKETENALTRLAVAETPTFESSEGHMYKTTIRVNKGQAPHITTLYAKSISQNKGMIFEYLNSTGDIERALIADISAPAPDPNLSYDILNLTIHLTPKQIALINPSVYRVIDIPSKAKANKKPIQLPGWVKLVPFSLN